MDELTEQIAEKERQLNELIKLREIAKNATWPQEVTIYAYCTAEYLRNLGLRIGLTGEGLNYFCWAQEYKIKILVYSDGSVIRSSD